MNPPREPTYVLATRADVRTKARIDHLAAVRGVSGAAILLDALRAGLPEIAARPASGELRIERDAHGRIELRLALESEADRALAVEIWRAFQNHCADAALRDLESNA